jgi:hypothetical protein
MWSLHATLEGVMNRTASLLDPLAYMQEDTDGLDDFIDRMRASHTVTTATGE